MPRKPVVDNPYFNPRKFCLVPFEMGRSASFDFSCSMTVSERIEFAGRDSSVLWVNHRHGIRGTLPQ